MAQEFAVYLQETGSFPSAFYPKKHNLWAEGTAVSSVWSPNCFTKAVSLPAPAGSIPVPGPGLREQPPVGICCGASPVSSLLFFILSLFVCS